MLGFGRGLVFGSRGRGYRGGPCEKLLEAPPAPSRTHLCTKAEPISGGGHISVITYLRRETWEEEWEL